MSEDNIYHYNVNLTNPGPAPIAAYSLGTRDSPILNNPSEFEMSIVRFQISSELIPLFHPVIPDPIGFPLRTNMSITLNYNNNFFQTFINVTAQEIKEGVFDYCPYLDKLNVAANTSFVALKAAFPAASPTTPPIFFLNSLTGIITMYVENTYLDTDPNRIRIGMNQPLQQIIDLPASLRNPVPSPFGYDYETSITDCAVLLPNAGSRQGYPVALNTLAVTLLGVSQEFKSLDEWSDVKSIIFTSSLIPMNREFIPNSVSSDQNYNTQDSSLPIVTDFDIVKDQVEPRGHCYQYFPTGEFRMISLRGRTGFKSIDITASYQTYDGKIRPIYIAAGDNMSLKILFRRIIKKV